MHNHHQRVTHSESRAASGNSFWGSVVLAGAALAVAYAAMRQSRYQYANKVVLITGGSRGLGLVMARQLASQGAMLGLLARDAAELARARQTISDATLVQLLPADVTDAAQVEMAVDELIRRCGRIDVVINNAGQILSAPFADTTDADFHGLLDVHFWGTLHTTRAALPHLSRQGEGRIINICSIGSRIPVPHLSAYCASKFAQAGLSGVLAEELRSSGIRVTTVMPGLMRTGSAHTHAWFKGDQPTEFANFSLVGGMPVTSMGAERAARLILSAAARGDAEAIVPFSVRQVAKMVAVAPNMALKTLAAINGALPGPGSKLPIQGRHMQLPKPIQAAVAMNERAADRNNQR